MTKFEPDCNGLSRYVMTPDGIWWIAVADRSAHRIASSTSVTTDFTRWRKVVVRISCVPMVPL